MSGRALSPAELAERAVAKPSGDASKERIVIVEDSTEAELRYANNTVTTNGVRRDRRLVAMAFERRQDGVSSGVASGTGAVDAADLFAAASSDAAGSPPAEDASDLVTEGADDDFSAEPEATSFSVLGPVLEELGDIFSRAEAEGRVMAGFATHRVTTTYLASTTGVRRRFVQPAGKLELVARAFDGSRSSWAGSGTTTFADVHVGDMEKRLVRNLSWAERTIELPPGRYETLLPADAVADLVVMIDAELSGREAEEGRNVFSAPGGGTKVGERLSTLPFRMRSDPSERALETAPWLAVGASSADTSVFDNGLPVGAVAWIDDGHLRRLRYHRAGARRSGTEFTPPGDNTVLELPGSSATLDDLVAKTERALLLTCLWYIRPVDPATLLLTGLTRDGVFLVENGEVVGAVNNFRFNESPVDMLARSIEAGASERALSREWGEWVTRTAMPPLRVADFNMSSVSPAT
jgi:predicted Zn-dependent protease